MNTGEAQGLRTKPDVKTDQASQGKRYQIEYSIHDYTFPTEARIHHIHFDDGYLHVELIDGRNLSIPLWWIPTLHDAEPAELEKYEIPRDRTLIYWDPAKCAINEIVRIADYLGPCPHRDPSSLGTNQ